MLIKRSIKNFLLRFGLIISSPPAEECLDKFLSSLRPFTTEHDLIRFGGGVDGGYLIPDDLNGLTACFSPGCSDVADFESSAVSLGLPCFLADYSVDAPALEHPLINFEKIYLGSQDSGNYIRLSSWVDKKAPNLDELILQMDIEGGEYGVILSSSDECLKKFRILVIEFHNFSHIFDKGFFEIIRLTFEKILKDFVIVHIHPNNFCGPVHYKKYAIPPVMEFTFLRKDRIKKKNESIVFPHPLDFPNFLDRKDYPLPHFWKVN